jgi:hypothetical protein
MKRRTFLQRISETSLLAAAPTALELSAKAAPSNRLQAGMIGSAGRAAALNRLFAVNPEVDIAAIAEIDPKRLPPTMAAVGRLQGRKPKVFTDYRHLQPPFSPMGSANLRFPRPFRQKQVPSSLSAQGRAILYLFAFQQLDHRFAHGFQCDFDPFPPEGNS